MLVQTLSIVGVGLIGGSIGMAARHKGVAAHVVGVGRQAGTLLAAQQLGAIDTFTNDLAEGVRGADLVVFCTPVDRIAAQVRDVAAHCRAGTLITDAGSTKAHIVAEIERIKLPSGVHFVGSHPLAGSEKRGPEHARADLFENRLAVVTPTAATDPDALERTAAFWRSLGMRVCRLDPHSHDRVLGVTSHLPHAIASALSAALPEDWRPFCATGFRDTTRVAAGDAELWAAIFRDNREGVLDALDRFTGQLAAFRSALESGDTQLLLDFLARAKENRDALGT